MVSLSRRELFQQLTKQLTRAEIPDARLEAQFLIEEVWGTALPQFLLYPDKAAEADRMQKALTLCEKRCTGYPLQYLFGSWDFCGMTFAIGEGVLIPRADTETLVETVLRLRKNAAATVITDLCSGSGCIPAACAAMLGHTTGNAVEKSAEAFPYLQKNLTRHAPQINIVQGDVLEQTTVDRLNAAGCCDVLTCNPPYLTAEDMAQLQREVTFEPSMALYGGEDGLDFYRQVTHLWKSHIKENGWLVYEIGMRQEADVLAILEQEGFTHCFTEQDLAGIIRVVAGQKTSK